MENRLNCSEPDLKIFDALVVGAGPSGSACAARLAERGWSVLALDREVPGRVRVCGGFLGPEFADWVRGWGWSAELERLPKSPVGRVQISGSGPRLVESDLPRGGGFAVDRGIFDRWMADTAAAKGAELWTGAQAADTAHADGFWTARVRFADGRPDRTVRARHWIDATGRRPANGRTGSFFACKAVYRGVRGLAGAVALHFIERGHVGLNPLNADETTLCLCVDGRYLRGAAADLDGMVRGFWASNPALKSQMADAVRISDWKTCQAEPDGDPIFYRDGRFRVGDALSMINPVIGGGIPIAMHSGVLLADLLAAARTDQKLLDERRVAADFERAWRKAFSQKFMFGSWIGAAERSAAGSRIVMGVLGAAPALLAPLVRMSRPEPVR